MSDLSAELKMLRLRMAGIGAQFDADWAAKLDAQLHLDRDTGECAYWHAGYYQALADVLDLVSTRQASHDISDMSNPFLAAG
jgi:hypothetical protein